MNKEKEGKFKVADYKNIELGECNGVSTFDNIKVNLKGKFSISHLKNDFNYDEELQLQVYGKDIKIEKRVENNWERVEIFLKFKDIDKLIEALIKLKNT